MHACKLIVWGEFPKQHGYPNSIKKKNYTVAVAFMLVLYVFDMNQNGHDKYLFWILCELNVFVLGNFPYNIFIIVNSFQRMDRLFLLLVFYLIQLGFVDMWSMI